ncbi:MAG: hypothetical protein IPK67_12705 [Planctomycetes bacterium]|nr:hypothetical protein [Planctomycetota bacterium]
MGTASASAALPGRWVEGAAGMGTQAGVASKAEAWSQVGAAAADSGAAAPVGDATGDATGDVTGGATAGAPAGAFGGR